MTSKTSASQGAVAAAVGPGKALSEARMQKRLSREQVAEMLHLSPQQIDALEKDDFDNLPGPTYVRGYLRSYAQALGLAPEDIIAAYVSANGTQQSISLSRFAPEPEVTTRDGSVKFATLLVAGILMLLAIVWWQGRHVPSPSPSAGDAQLTTDVTSVAPRSIDERAAEESATRSGFVVPRERTEEARTITSVASEPTRGSGASSSGAVTDPTFSPAGSQYGLTTPLSTEHGDPSAEGVPEDKALLGPPLSDTTPSSATRLVLYARDASWADVRDAHDTRLVYELLAAGRLVTIVGTPPFNVFLGNPDAVALEYQGEHIAASQYKRGTVARFTVGTPATDSEQ